MNGKAFFPIILGSDENAYGTARLFNEAYSVRPMLLCARQLIPTVYSKLFDIKCVKDLDREEIFVPELLKTVKEKKQTYEKVLVVACSDYYSAMMSKHFDKFEGLIANRYNTPELLDTLDTKDKFYSLCEKFGMTYPKTYVATPEDRISAIDSLPFGFPIVVKPENSNATDYLHVSFEGKKKVFFFDDRESYLRVIKSMNDSDYKGKLIIQEFIPGDDSAMRVMNSYSSSEGKVRAMGLGQPVLEEYHPKTLGNYAAIISRSDKALYGQIADFLEKIGYVGFANIDMKYDAKSGKYYMMEINPRLGRSSFFLRAAGMNMMKIMTDDVVFGEERPVELLDNTAFWANVPKIVIRKYLKNDALKKEIKSLIKAKKYMRTLDCPGDNDIRRVLRIKKYYYGQYMNFKNFYFDKNKEGIKK